MSTIASIASAIGVARRPTHGSWRPVVTISTALPCDVDRAAGHLDAGGGLEGQVRDDVLAGGDAAEDAAGVVARESRAGVSSSRCSLPFCATARVPAPISTALTALMLMRAWAISASSRSNTGSPRPGGTPLATTVTRAPIESPALRSFQISSSSSAMRAGSGQKNGFW